jgi:hypothetical protein
VVVIVIKGSKVSFLMQDGTTYRLPLSYGIIHDPDGTELHRCTVYFGRYVKSHKAAAKPSRKATRYFGQKYSQREAVVNVPDGPWADVGETVKIFYERTQGSQYEGPYFHNFKQRYFFIFKQRSPTLSKCKGYYRLQLKDGCIIDDRGFVFP